MPPKGQDATFHPSRPPTPVWNASSASNAFGFLQIERNEAFGETAVNRSEKPKLPLF